MRYQTTPTHTPEQQRFLTACAKARAVFSEMMTAHLRAACVRAFEEHGDSAEHDDARRALFDARREALADFDRRFNGLLLFL